MQNMNTASISAISKFLNFEKSTINEEIQYITLFPQKLGSLAII